jgi:hypothetical protein
MSCVIIDENVAIVANDVTRISTGRPPLTRQADDKCRLATIRRVRQVISKETVIVDSSDLVMRGYRRHLSGKGQPGVGDAFLRWVSDHLYDSTRVRQVPLTSDEDGQFSAFPSDPDLRSFDRADRVFVALAIESGDAVIVNAVDSDYRLHQSGLDRFGVRVEELCEHCLK